MIRLGHIEFSNCFPVHALLIDRGAPPGIELHTGMPSELNAWLDEGRIDVAPASSIEYARHADRYRILPGFVIGSRGPVGSIIFESTVEPERLHGREVALPTASATSVVLLRTLLETRLGIQPRYRWFDQASDPDPLRSGAAAALWIGDVALRRDPSAAPHRLDLGAEWMDWTGLPFAFALWQVAAGPELDRELAGLVELLHRSRAYFHAELDALACRHAARFGIAEDRLREYWRSLEFDLDDDMRRGILHFYSLAAALGEAPEVTTLRLL